MLKITEDAINAPAGFSLDRPPHLEEMFVAAEKLSEIFPFVRVDFYDTKERLIFGELTFTPGGGFDSGRSVELQNELGSLLDLAKVPEYAPVLSAYSQETMRAGD